jgi:hypothetical protein
MARYMLAHLQLGRLHEARILQEPTARRMQSELFRHDPDVNPFLHGFYRSDRNGIAVFGHMGDIKQFHSELALFPEHGLAVFVSFNSQPGATLPRCADQWLHRSVLSGQTASDQRRTRRSTVGHGGAW